MSATSLWNGATAEAVGEAAKLIGCGAAERAQTIQESVLLPEPEGVPAVL